MTADNPQSTLARAASNLRPVSRHYAVRIAAATLFTAVAVQLADTADWPFIASIASSAFLVFCLPLALMSQRRNVLGSYVIAVLVAALISPLGEGVGSIADREVIAVVAVGLAWLAMALTGTEHVPAAGAVFGMGIKDWETEAAASVLLMALLLVVAQAAMRRLGLLAS